MLYLLKIESTATTNHPHKPPLAYLPVFFEFSLLNCYICTRRIPGNIVYPSVFVQNLPLNLFKLIYAVTFIVRRLISFNGI